MGKIEQHSTRTEDLYISTIVSAACILLATLIASVIWSHYKIFWVDELLGYFSDTKPTVARIIHDQNYLPFATDPAEFPLISHFFLRLLPGSPELATRLPSILSLLVSEVCVFILALRLTKRQEIALLAMAIPFILVTLNYAPEARNYSFLTATLALSLVFYTSAIDGTRRRPLALIGFFVSLSAAILCHYYGVFLGLPIIGAEVDRLRERRRFDWPVLISIVAAYSLVVAHLPAMHTLHEIQQHYYDLGTTGWNQIPFTYLFFLDHFRAYGDRDHGAFIYSLYLLVAIGLMVAILTLLLRRNRYEWRTAPERPLFVALVITLFLPVWNVFIAHNITHAYMPRYSLPACIAIAVLAAVALAPYLSARGASIALVLVLAYAAFFTYRRTGDARKISEAEIAHLADDALLHAAQATAGDRHIYIQGVTEFLAAAFYGPTDVKREAVGVFSDNREMFYLSRNTASTYMRNLGLTTPLHVVSYESLQSDRGARLFLVYDDPLEEWDNREFATKRVHAEYLGKTMGGKLFRVTFLDKGESQAHGG
jgi:hypothetical protein